MASNQQDQQQGSDAGRLVSLSFKKSTGQGLSDDEKREYDKLQSQSAMQRRMQVTQ